VALARLIDPAHAPKDGTPGVQILAAKSLNFTELTELGSPVRIT